MYIHVFLLRQKTLVCNVFKDIKYCQAPVAYSCNLSYSGGRDQCDQGLKPAWANSSERPYLKKSFTKIGLVEWLEARALSSRPSTEKKKKRY
jgi:hypothetical protein